MSILDKLYQTRPAMPLHG